MKAKAEKEVTIKKYYDVDIKDITLLSIEEYEMCKDIIPEIDNWWLRSPGIIKNCVAYVRDKDTINLDGVPTDCIRIVRPALVYEPNNLQIGDNISLLVCEWIVISHNMMLCDRLFGYTCFNKNCEVENANDYEKSDIKGWLHDWLKERIKYYKID